MKKKNLENELEKKNDENKQLADLVESKSKETENLYNEINRPKVCFIDIYK